MNKYIISFIYLFIVISHLDKSVFQIQSPLHQLLPLKTFEASKTHFSQLSALCPPHETVDETKSHIHKKKFTSEFHLPLLTQVLSTLAIIDE